MRIRAPPCDVPSPLHRVSMRCGAIVIAATSRGISHLWVRACDRETRFSNLRGFVLGKSCAYSSFLSRLLDHPNRTRRLFRLSTT